ncbi:hypothetical protein J1G44_07890 [Cellulomonas sp. zg-ZUI199]|uniref:SPOR domain-containing protein n=1 Tax=Cellulomonas wangleii TaxID=2816956 RepID=A0ABX8D5P2_9CELL|nr:hypothetical protein [Cellulomonas wangleii]MBO0924403.1 hypothetical protein [Cellulomonas wangleii]QVI62401.1 hypothetical protein KG103_00070 [Cellulomonas wangleii]
MHETQPDFPIWGDIVWLTPEQGGRESGPPPTPWDRYYHATAFVPPQTSSSGLASISLHVSVRDAWTSHAKARWLVPPGPVVDEGSVIMVTEGPRTVAVFAVTHVERGQGHADLPRPPLSGQAIAEIEARAGAATRGPWRSFVEGRDHLAGDSFVMTGTEKDRGPDIYLTWDPLVSEEQRLADQDFIAHARQDVTALAMDLRELRVWHELEEVDEEIEEPAVAGDLPDGYQQPSVAYVVQTDPSQPESYQLGGFTSEREALKALYEARRDRPSESWVINMITVWDRFTDYRSES